MKKFYGPKASEFIKNLKLIDSSESAWTEVYVDEGGQQWLKYMVDKDTGRYYNVMLISPRPTTEEIIEIAFTSLDHDEVEGAAYRLFIEAQEEMNDFTPRLVERLKSIDVSNLSAAATRRIQTIILNTHLLDSRNKREVVGKSASEVQADWDYFINVGQFAEKLLNQIRPRGIKKMQLFWIELTGG
jgi:hypothetical protein